MSTKGRWRALLNSPAGQPINAEQAVALWQRAPIPEAPGLPIGSDPVTGSPVSGDPVTWVRSGTVPRNRIVTYGDTDALLQRWVLGAGALGVRPVVLDGSGPLVDSVVALGGQAIDIGRGADGFNVLEHADHRLVVTTALVLAATGDMPDVGQQRLLATAIDQLSSGWTQPQAPLLWDLIAVLQRMPDSTSLVQTLQSVVHHYGDVLARPTTAVVSAQAPALSVSIVGVNPKDGFLRAAVQVAMWSACAGYTQTHECLTLVRPEDVIRAMPGMLDELVRVLDHSVAVVMRVPSARDVPPTGCAVQVRGDAEDYEVRLPGRASLRARLQQSSTEADIAAGLVCAPQPSLWLPQTPAVAAAEPIDDWADLGLDWLVEEPVDGELDSNETTWEDLDAAWASNAPDTDPEPEEATGDDGQRAEALEAPSAQPPAAAPEVVPDEQLDAHGARESLPGIVAAQPSDEVSPTEAPTDVLDDEPAAVGTVDAGPSITPLTLEPPGRDLTLHGSEPVANLEELEARAADEGLATHVEITEPEAGTQLLESDASQSHSGLPDPAPVGGSAVDTPAEQVSDERAASPLDEPEETALEPDEAFEPQEEAGPSDASASDASAESGTLTDAIAAPVEDSADAAVVTPDLPLRDRDEHVAPDAPVVVLPAAAPPADHRRRWLVLTGSAAAAVVIAAAVWAQTSTTTPQVTLSTSSGGQAAAAVEAPALPGANLAPGSRLPTGSGGVLAAQRNAPDPQPGGGVVIAREAPNPSPGAGMIAAATPARPLPDFAIRQVPWSAAAVWQRDQLPVITQLPVAAPDTNVTVPQYPQPANPQVAPAQSGQGTSNGGNTGPGPSSGGSGGGSQPAPGPPPPNQPFNPQNPDSPS